MTKNPEEPDITHTVQLGMEEADLFAELPPEKREEILDARDQILTAWMQEEGGQMSGRERRGVKRAMRHNAAARTILTSTTETSIHTKVEEVRKRVTREESLAGIRTGKLNAKNDIPKEVHSPLAKGVLGWIKSLRSK